MPKKPLFITLMESQHAFSQIFLSISKKFSSKNIVYVVSEISRVFLNVLAPEDKYSLSLGKSECLTKSIQMIFSQKHKIFSQFFSPFLTPTSQFKHAEEKDQSHS